MLKIMSNTIETGTEIAILNKWRKQIAETLKKDDFPQTFKVKQLGSSYCPSVQGKRTAFRT